MYRGKFAVVDLETTGNNKNRDSIIQLSIVFVEDMQIVDQYSTFLSDDTNLSPFIRELTGIEPNMLKGAPKFNDVAEEVAAMLQGCIFTAHNVEFDFGFLKTALKNADIRYEPVYKIDTVELTKIFMPTLERFQLSEVARAIGLDLSNAHRADEDARATSELLIKLLYMITSMNTETLKQLYTLSKPLKFNLSDLLFTVIADQNDSVPKNLKKIGSVYLKKRASHTKVIEPINVRELYQKYIDYTGNDYREDQLRLALNIYTAFEEGRHMAVEAYTGLGKTVSFLIAAISYHSMYGKNILLSTSRKILQNQIISHDFDTVQKAAGFNINAVSLKGRKNYISLDALELLLSFDDDNKEIIYLKMKLLVWLLDTDTGDLAEIHLRGPEQAYYKTVEIQSGHSGSHPFFEKMMADANDSMIIITNHYFLMDCLEYIPDFDAVLVDEAHQLKNALVERVQTSYNYQAMKFFIGQVGLSSQDRLLSLYINHNNESHIYLLEDLLSHLNQNIDLLFSSISAGRFDEAISHLNNGIKHTSTFLGTIRGTKNYQILYNHIHYYQELLKAIKQGMENDDFTIAANNNFQKMTVYVHDHFKEPIASVIDKISSSVLLSGTLEVGGSFKHLDFWFGDHPYDTQVISQDNLFDKTSLFIPEDIPDYDTGDEQYIEAIVEYIAMYLTETDSKLMVLFSNYDLLDKVSDYTGELQMFEEYVILKQSRSTSSEKLLTQFNQLDKCLLLGTSGFNEGINIESGSAKCLMLTKLPFPVPKEQGFRNFYKQDLPEAVFAFRQIAGRIRRNPEDKGIILLFDNRILTRNYKKAFLKYFPNENIIHGTRDTFKGLLRDL
ncbi:helicase C-terminal domain-containing protein [Salinicoccus albus]|uniref:helicase C-terminal domain-containing protein n=1 Tax=Salinicoccus albus TaxID=418756 RepID=UPI00037EF91D|nr:helicase C-terminal domain-containing protein [Salinicoccus albus]